MEGKNLLIYLISDNLKDISGVMVSNISVFGSCINRSIFNSKIVPNYKNFFNIAYYNQFVTLVSLMSEPVPHDKIICSTSFREFVVKSDLEKDFLNEVNNDKTIKYLIIDNYCDATQGILELENGSFITNSRAVKDSNLYKELDIKSSINIFKNTEKYFSIWKKSCDEFFEFLNTNRPDIQIILNVGRLVYKYSLNGQVCINKKFKKKAVFYNKAMDLFDYYMSTKFDVDILTFEDYLFDEDFIFGCSPTHYEQKYYLDKIVQLDEIVERNENLGKNSEMNKEFRKLKRNKFIVGLNTNKLMKRVNGLI